MVTLESVTKKLGFDPRFPPEIPHDGWRIDDSIPSRWAPLTREELVFVYELRTGEKCPF